MEPEASFIHYTAGWQEIDLINDGMTELSLWCDLNTTTTINDRPFSLK